MQPSATIFRLKVVGEGNGLVRVAVARHVALAALDIRRGDTTRACDAGVQTTGFPSG